MFSFGIVPLRIGDVSFMEGVLIRKESHDSFSILDHTNKEVLMSREMVEFNFGKTLYADNEIGG